MLLPVVEKNSFFLERDLDRA